MRQRPPDRVARGRPRRPGGPPPRTPPAADVRLPEDPEKYVRRDALGLLFEQPLVEADGRSLQIKSQDFAVQLRHPALIIAFRRHALCAEAAGFRFNLLRLFDPI